MNRIVYKLPEEVRVCKNADQVRPIRDYKLEGKRISNWYMRMFLPSVATSNSSPLTRTRSERRIWYGMVWYDMVRFNH